MRRLFIIFGFICSLLFLSDLKSCENPVGPVEYTWGLVQAHPFLIAAVIIILLQKEPWKFLKEMGEYFIEERPILSMFVLGLVISCSFVELAQVLKTSESTIKFTTRLVSRLIYFLEQRF